MAASSTGGDVRMAITTDWDAGFLLTSETKPLDDVPSGGEYVVECTPQDDVVLQDVTTRDFVLDRLYVGKLFASVVADERPVATGSVADRRYRLEPPISVAKTCDIRAVLKNVSDAPKKPKVAVLIPGGQEIVGSTLKDWRVLGVHVGSAAKPLSPSCPTCDSPDHDVRRQLTADGPGSSCSDTWHTAGARKVVVHAPRLARTLYDGPGNATIVSGCSCGAETPSARAFADHVGISEGALAAMLDLVGIIYDLCDYPAAMTHEELARRVARCLEFSR